RTIAAREARRGVDELGGGIRPLLLASQPAPDLVDLSLNFTGAADAARGGAGHLLLPRLDLAGEPGLRLGRLADLVPRFDRLPRRRRTPSRLVGFARRLQPGAELLHRFRPGGGEELLYPPTLAGKAPLERCQPFLEKAPATRRLLALLTRGDRAEKARGRDAEGGDGEDGQPLPPRQKPQRHGAGADADAAPEPHGAKRIDGTLPPPLLHRSERLAQAGLILAAARQGPVEGLQARIEVGRKLDRSEGRGAVQRLALGGSRPLEPLDARVDGEDLVLKSAQLLVEALELALRRKLGLELGKQRREALPLLGREHDGPRQGPKPPRRGLRRIHEWLDRLKGTEMTFDRAALAVLLDLDPE